MTDTKLFGVVGLVILNAFVVCDILFKTHFVFIITSALVLIHLEMALLNLADGRKPGATVRDSEAR